ncbi:hypothetical protein Tco_0431287 [Tanacetum coccineum]
MPPRPMNQAAIERLITERVTAAVEAERQRQGNARGQGNNEAGGQGGRRLPPRMYFSEFMKFYPLSSMDTRELACLDVVEFPFWVKRGNKVVKKELIVALRGEIYFVKFIINLEEDDVEPGVIFGRSFLRMTKSITDFEFGTVTIYPDIDPFLEETDQKSYSSSTSYDSCSESGKWFQSSMDHPLSGSQGLASPEQTATGKDILNPFMAVMTCQKSYSSSTSYDSCSESGKWFQSSMDHPLSGLICLNNDSTQISSSLYFNLQSLCVWKKAVPLKNVNWKPDYKGSYTKEEEATGQWRIEIRLWEHTMMRPDHHDPNLKSNNEPWMGIASTKLYHEFYSTYKFDEVSANDELQTKKIIKFRLGGRAYSLTLLEFAQRTTGYDKVQKNDMWLLSLFDARHQNGVLTKDVVGSLSAPIYCRDLDTTTLRDLIDSDGKLIPEDPQPGVPRVGIPRPPRASMQDLYDRMVFEHMAGVYSVPLQGAYNPPGYAQPQYDQYYQ